MRRRFSNQSSPTNGQAGYPNLVVCRQPMSMSFQMFDEETPVELIAEACVQKWGGGHLKQTGHLMWEWVPAQEG